MTIRQTRMFLWGAAGLLLAGSVVAASLAKMLPLDSDAAANGEHPTRQPVQQAGDAAVGPLSDFQPVWGLRLRQPLFDLPPAAAVVVKKPPLPVRLTGTATEDPKNSCGFFLVQGKLVMAAVGETIKIGDNSVVILKIAPGAAVVRWCGEESTLKPEAGEGQEKE